MKNEQLEEQEKLDIIKEQEEDRNYLQMLQEN